MTETAESGQPRNETDEQDATQGFLPVANTWVVGARGWYTELFGANKCRVVFVACPATVKEGVESE